MYACDRVVAVGSVLYPTRCLTAAGHRCALRVPEAVSVCVPVEYATDNFVDVAVTIVVFAVADLAGGWSDARVSVIAVRAADERPTVEIAGIHGQEAIAIDIGLPAAHGRRVTVLVAMLNVENFGIPRIAVGIGIITINPSETDGLCAVAVDIDADVLRYLRLPGTLIGHTRLDDLEEGAAWLLGRLFG